MKMKKIIPYLIVFLILAAIAAAIQPPSEVYFGHVYLEDDLAEDGKVLTIETESGELLASQTLPFGDEGSYAINIEFDDPITPEDEGADDGEGLVWKVNDLEVLTPTGDTAEIGKTNNNFDISAYGNPDLSINVSLLEDEIAMNGQVNVTVLMENSGEGTAKVNIHVISDGVDSEIPGSIEVNKQSTNSITIPLIAETCGENNVDIVISYYNVADQLIDSITNPINFTSKGYDIELTSLEVSNLNPDEDELISISAVISNVGDYDIDEFEISFYDQITDGNLIKNIESNDTLIADDDIAVQFNWRVPSGTFEIHGVLDIEEQECNTANNENDGGTITVGIFEEEETVEEDEINIEEGEENETLESDGGGFIQDSIVVHGADIECIEHNIKLNVQGTIVELKETCDLVIFDYKNKEYNLSFAEKEDNSVKLMIKSKDYTSETVLNTNEIKELDLALDDSYGVYFSLVESGETARIKIGLMEDQSITGFITKESKAGIPILILIMIIAIVAILGFFIKKGAITIPSFRISKSMERIADNPGDVMEKYEDKELKKTKSEIGNSEVLQNIGLIKKHDDKEILPEAIKKHEIKKKSEEIHLNKFGLIRKPEDNKESKITEKPEVEEKEEVQQKLETASPEKKSIGLFSRLRMSLDYLRPAKKVPKFDPGLSKEERKYPQVPYEYLSEAIELFEKVKRNLGPRDELIRKYSNRYPVFLIDLVARNVFMHSRFRENIDVVKELEKLEVLDKEYKYISVNKLEKAIEILAKGYALKENKNKKRGIFVG